MASRNSTFLIGLMAAAAVGAALGLLLAPKKGSETRKDIQDKINDLSDQVKRISKKARHQVNNLHDDYVTGSSGIQ
jgi:gas vesicle protein